jgi:hypothetical protein
VTTNVGASVKVTWGTALDDGGSPITSVLVELRDHAGTHFYQQPLYCNGVSDATVRNQGYCVIPMSELTKTDGDSPLGLLLGDPVVARLQATNAVGSSAASDAAIIAGQSYAKVKTRPAKPPTAPVRGASTSTSQIQVDIAALTGDDTGDDPIRSYHIEYR